MRGGRCSPPSPEPPLLSLHYCTFAPSVCGSSGSGLPGSTSKISGEFLSVVFSGAGGPEQARCWSTGGQLPAVLNRHQSLRTQGSVVLEEFISAWLSGSNQRRRAAVVALHRGAANLASLGSELLLLDVQQEPPGGSEGSGTFLWQLLLTTVAAAKAPSIVRFWWCPEKHTPVVLSYRRSQNHRTDL